MSTALLFPGQGTDAAEAATLWRSASPHVMRLMSVAADVLEIPPAALLRDLSLARTEVAQAVLTALGAGIAREITELGVAFDAVAGHSVGELAACAAAGAIDAEDAVHLAAHRGHLMAREAARRPGGMIAVRASRDEVEASLEPAAACRGREWDDGCHLYLAVHNGPHDWVLSGNHRALCTVSARSDATPVPTPGAWHSPAMAAARAPYERALRSAVTGTLSVPLISNRTGRQVATADSLPSLLADQLDHSVLWADSMCALRQLGITRVISCGPGRSLRRFARPALADAAFVDLTTPGSLAMLAPQSA